MPSTTRRLALCSLLVSCGGSTRPPPPAPSQPEDVPPPVERLAEAEGVSARALLDLPAETLDPIEPLPAAPIPDDRAEEYGAKRAKTVVQLQPWRTATDLEPGVSLVDLHPRHHRAFLLTVGDQTWHLENRSPSTVLVDLAHSNATGIALVHLADDQVERCKPWAGSPSPLAEARTSGRPYVPICGEHLLVRTTVAGRRSSLEWATELVRGNAPYGEHLASLVKKTTQDRHRKVAAIDVGEAAPEEGSGPRPFRMTQQATGKTVSRKDLGFPVPGPDKVVAGRWLAVEGHDGVFAAALAPGLTALPEDEPSRTRATSQDSAELGALALFMAIDLASFDLEFEVGTEHPAVGWSARALPASVDRSLPGPDGIGTLSPIGLAAQVPPLEATRLEASFIGGFKREHAAFKEGALAEVPGASHYGVVQDGLVFSRLQPGLATLMVTEPGAKVEIRTWTSEDEPELDRVLHARQNGVPLLQDGEVSPLIANWRAGNWSGSATGEARTIRSGACIQEGPNGRYLIYGYFTAATPRTMARAFLAAGCRDAIHLDMNALEHTYAALYDRTEDGWWKVHHLDRGMSVLDKQRKGTTLPRFVAFPDNRDFFTVLRK